MKDWNYAKTKVHDISGLENPENYMLNRRINKRKTLHV